MNEYTTNIPLQDLSVFFVSFSEGGASYLTVQKKEAIQIIWCCASCFVTVTLFFAAYML
ncbi:hypothetical protein [Ectobacillus polymachus]|uniref:hypothetical protein n=1 Tax=Ectobacillus polymachus TaxID=1508806 RepID=UPI003A871D52